MQNITAMILNYFHCHCK